MHTFRVWQLERNIGLEKKNEEKILCKCDELSSPRRKYFSQGSRVRNWKRIINLKSILNIISDFLKLIIRFFIKIFTRFTRFSFRKAQLSFPRENELAVGTRSFLSSPSVNYFPIGLRRYFYDRKFVWPKSISEWSFLLRCHMLKVTMMSNFSCETNPCGLSDKVVAVLHFVGSWVLREERWSGIPGVNLKRVSECSQLLRYKHVEGFHLFLHLVYFYIPNHRLDQL